MDYIGVKKLDPAGGLVGEHRFIGLFTSRAYAEDAERIPILRDKLQQLLQASGVTPDSHDYKEIHTIFNSMPKEDLFLTSAEQIGADIRAALTAYNTDEVRVTLREDVLHRGVSAMVIIPHERYSGKVRRDVEGVLATALGGETLNFYLALGGGDQARLHFYLVAEPGRMRTVRDSDLERSIRELMRSWTDRVGEGLERVRPPDDARRHARRYAEAFSAEYQAITSPDMAVQDILELEAMHADGRELSVSFSNSADLSWVPGDEPLTELKVYLKRERLVLSEFMPTLENAGLRVIAVNPFEVRGGGVPPALIYVFAVQDAASRPLDVEARGSALGQTILAVRAGDVSDDILEWTRSLVRSALARGRCAAGVRCGPHQLLPERRPRPVTAIRGCPLHVVQVRVRCSVGGDQEPTPVRGVGPLLPDGRGAPARCQGRAWRHPLERPAGRFPHRDPGSGEDPDGQECGDRPGRLEGWVGSSY